MYINGQWPSGGSAFAVHNPANGEQIGTAPDGGAADARAMLRQMQRGLWVTELMGQGVNGVTGDYSRGATGFWIENGEVAYPVHELTIAGNLRDMYRNMIAIGTDVDVRGGIRVGSILLDELTIAGE